MEQALTTGRALELRAWSKTFNGVRVLANVDMDIRQGEIRGLLGQNGSGKSTLIKILAGYHSPDSGAQCRINGEIVNLPLDSATRRRLGISFVHQELGLQGDLSILDNMVVGRYPVRGPGKISWRGQRRRVRDALARFGLELDPDQSVNQLGDIERALVGIARAMLDVVEAGSQGILVLDEPTVYLPRTDTERLFAAMRDAAHAGVAVLFVTHSLQEVRAITDSVSILRSGKMIGTYQTADTSEEELVTLIVGREVGQIYPDKLEVDPRQPLLKVEGLTGYGVRDVSLEARPGQVVGLTGLVGSGFESVLYALFGARRASAGQMTLDGVDHKLRNVTPSRAMALGLALVPANRHRDAVVEELPVLDNVGLPILRRHMRSGLLREGSVRRAVAATLSDMGVQPVDPDRAMATLSGGNQQKAVLGKWLQGRPRILLLHEPTQGVDVGARKQIFEIIKEAARHGTTVLIASSEHTDLAHLCSEIHVFRDGRVGSVLSGLSISEDRVIAESLRSA